MKARDATNWNTCRSRVEVKFPRIFLHSRWIADGNWTKRSDEWQLSQEMFFPWVIVFLLRKLPTLHPRKHNMRNRFKSCGPSFAHREIFFEQCAVHTDILFTLYVLDAFDFQKKSNFFMCCYLCVCFIITCSTKDPRLSASHIPSLTVRLFKLNSIHVCKVDSFFSTLFESHFLLFYRLFFYVYLKKWSKEPSHFFNEEQIPSDSEKSEAKWGEKNCAGK